MHSPSGCQPYDGSANKGAQVALAVTMTHKDVACVMLATRDVLEGMVFNTEALRWLCDSCTDTDLVSRDFATKEKLDIDTTVRIRIGTAGGASFLTDGVATVKLPIIDTKGNKHTTASQLCSKSNFDRSTEATSTTWTRPSLCTSPCPCLQVLAIRRALSSVRVALCYHPPPPPPLHLLCQVHLSHAHGSRLLQLM